jgi:hypothetical protein
MSSIWCCVSGNIRLSLALKPFLGYLLCGCGDIEHTLLQAPSSVQHLRQWSWVCCWNCWKIIVLICRAKYGGKVTSRDFWHHLRECLVRLGFTSSRADNGVWFRLSKRSTGEELHVLLLSTTSWWYQRKLTLFFEKRLDVERGINWSSVQVLRWQATWWYATEWSSRLGIWPTPIRPSRIKHVQELYVKAWNCYTKRLIFCLQTTDYCPKIDVMPELGEADALY